MSVICESCSDSTQFIYPQRLIDAISLEILEKIHSVSSDCLDLGNVEDLHSILVDHKRLGGKSVVKCIGPVDQDEKASIIFFALHVRVEVEGESPYHAVEVLYQRGDDFHSPFYSLSDEKMTSSEYIEMYKETIDKLYPWVSVPEALTSFDFMEEREKRKRNAVFFCYPQENFSQLFRNLLSGETIVLDKDRKRTYVSLSN